jgi:hypothetical protein
MNNVPDREKPTRVRYTAKWNLTNKGANIRHKTWGFILFPLSREHEYTGCLKISRAGQDVRFSGPIRR